MKVILKTKSLNERVVFRLPPLQPELALGPTDAKLLILGYPIT